jgi:hypothetical protein
MNREERLFIEHFYDNRFDIDMCVRCTSFYDYFVITMARFDFKGSR